MTGYIHRCPWCGTEEKSSSWTRRPDLPRWLWEVKFDNETVPSASGYVDNAGLDALDEVVRQLPGLIYRMPEEPHTLHIELTVIPF